jgi:AraC-like DNA-binding protein
MARVSEVLYPHRLIQLVSSGPFKLDLQGSVSGPMVLSRVAYRGVTGLDCPCVDRVHVNVLLSGKLSSVSAGRCTLLTRGDAVAYRPGADAKLVVPSGSVLDVVALKLDRTLVRETLDELLGRPVNRPVVLEGEVNLGSADGRAWRRLLLDSCRHYLSGSFLADPRLSAPLSFLLVAGLLRVARHQYSEELAAPATRISPAHVVRARDFIEADPRAPLTPASIAWHVGVSVRALQRAFRDYLDCTPMQYVRYCRMRGAKAELAETEPGTRTVAGVAESWGFHNHGRFANDYRQLFGMNPSQTLASAR